jgi:diguanylate cyclase (GGDEF)-like protein/PAS domain S-box-containing protein
MTGILLAGYFGGKQFNIEHMGIAYPISVDSVPSGHMSPITATALLATASAVLFLVFSYGGRRHFTHVAAFLAMGVGLTGFVILLGYLYGTPLLYGGTIIPVALPTGIALMLTGLGLLAASGPSVLPFSIISGSTVRGQLMRAFLPAITIFVLIEGLIYRATYTRTANPALLSSLIALVSIVVVSTIISRISKSIGNEIERAHAGLTRAEEEKRKSDKKYKDLFDSTRDGIFQVNAEGVFVLINRAGAQIFGYENPDEIIGRNALGYWREPKDRDAYRTVLMMQKTVSAYPMKARNKDGEPIELESSTRIIEDEKGTFLGIEGILRDVTERKRIDEKVRLMAYYDSLTGLPNRTFYEELLHRAVLLAKRYNRVMAVLFIDLDRFKLVNDTFGHETGDKLLRAVADVIETCVRKSDYLARSVEEDQSNIVSRLGGDEFIVLLNEISHAQDASIVAQRILRELTRPFSLDGHEVSVSVSIGIALYPQDSEDHESLMKNADAAMYHAKSLGRNNYRFYAAYMNDTPHIGQPSLLHDNKPQ